MNQMQADLIVKWYLELEDRLMQILRTTLYTPETQSLFLPPLANIVLDACSLLDAVFREEFVGPTKREDLTIVDYSLYFEQTYALASLRTVMYQYPLLYLVPFEGWSLVRPYQPLKWWQAYNSLKHDRIRECKNATLENAVLSLCALHQVISQSQTFLNALIRQDLVCFGDWGKACAKDAAYQKKNTDVTILIETDLLATPLGADRFPEDVKAISPHRFSTGRKLWRYVGREF